MRDRFHRSGHAGVSFFAFQDIITSVTAILLIITVFLSLNIKDAPTAPESSSESESKELKEQLAQLLRDVADRRQKAESSSDRADAAPRSLEIEIALLEKEASDLMKFVAENSAAPKVNPRSALEEATARDIAAERLDLLLIQKRIERLTKEEAAISAERAEAEASVRRIESELLNQEKKKNRLVLIHETSRTTKEPIIAVISGKGGSFHRFDTAAGEQISGPADFRRLLKKHSALDHYFVFYNKPSGAGLIDEYVDAARNAGFEVGYDAVPEDFELELETANGTQK
ncbi:MAG TPA: hypothetical protein VG796_01285 [Verrucomicrobiales bacterium]|nr:hypothetical protein [Verrucomicrobiales bacterium]